jgi:hypothetical protein
MPMLNPCAPLTDRTTRIAVWVKVPSSATSSEVRSV